MGEQLEAGRTLDEMVAEKVMGWRRGTRYGNGNGEWIRPGEEKARFKTTWDQTPHFSTDIAAAWLVVQHLASLEPDPWMFRIENWRHYERRWYTAHFSSHPLGPEPVEAQGDTAPLAICRAALAALAKTESRTAAVSRGEADNG